MALRLDLSLSNVLLYDGCKIEKVAGRDNLTTSIPEAIQKVGENAKKIVDVSNPDRDEVTLTGPMAVWAYMIVFHEVVHRFKKVYYDDGKNGPVLIAAHG